MTQVVILAAGRGTRLGSLKDPRSKAMMPVVGVPLIGCVLRAFLETGLRKFVVVHRPGDRELEVYLQKFREGEAEVQCAVQEEPQGMGHALGCAVPLINDRFLLTACDSVFSKESLARFIGQWELRRDVEALLGLEYAKNKDLSQRSAVVLDGLKIRQIVEKPAVHEITTDVTSVPLYGFGEKILPAIHRLERSLRGEFELQPAIQALITQGAMVEGIFIDRKWNLTRPSDLLAMNLSVLRQAVGTQGLWHGAEREAVVVLPPVWIDPGVWVGPSTVIGPEVYLEGGCEVGEGVNISQAVVLRQARIPPHSRIQGRVVV